MEILWDAVILLQGIYRQLGKHVHPTIVTTLWFNMEKNGNNFTVYRRVKNIRLTLEENALTHWKQRRMSIFTGLKTHCWMKGDKKHTLWSHFTGDVYTFPYVCKHREIPRNKFTKMLTTIISVEENFCWSLLSYLLQFSFYFLYSFLHSYFFNEQATSSQILSHREWKSWPHYCCCMERHETRHIKAWAILTLLALSPGENVYGHNRARRPFSGLSKGIYLTHAT